MAEVISEDVVVSYWSGILPEVSYLHFLSFRVLNPNTKYVLYLEKDHDLNGTIPPQLSSKLSLLDIDIEVVELTKLMDELGVPSFAVWRENSFFRIARRVARRFAPMLFALGVRKHLFFSSTMGFTLSHKFPFSGFKTNLPYRSDLFRSLIHSRYEEKNFLYVDLDICFIKSCDFKAAPMGTIAQWGTSDFGNSAYLMLPTTASKAKRAILDNLLHGVSALPWILYNQERVTDYGLSIIDCAYLDPAWSPRSVIYQDSSLFFREGDHVQDFLQEVYERCLGVHWHNQWSVRPDTGSPYSLLVSHFENGLLAFHPSDVS
jgi:hypothetical protein